MPRTKNSTLVDVKGKGYFPGWTSSHAWLKFRVVFRRDEAIAYPERGFTQSPKGGGRGCLPHFKEDEMERMKEDAIKIALRRSADGNASSTGITVVPAGSQDLQHKSLLCQKCLILGFSCTGLLTDCDGTTLRVPFTMQRNRKGRLEEEGVTKLFHQTDEACANLILDSRQLKRGNTGSLGGGIYFATSTAATDLKAIRRGIYLAADVLLGNTKTATAGHSYTFKDLLEEGFDSVCGTFFRSGLEEYVVYNYDQVTNIRQVNHDGSEIVIN